MQESNRDGPPTGSGCPGGVPPRELLGIGLLGLLLAASFLWGNPILSERHLASLWSDPDIAWQAYPAKALLARAAAEGRLPLENPHIFGGMPFAGNPQAQLFYPASALFLGDVARIPSAFALSAWLHFGLCFAGAFLLGHHVLAGLPARRGGALFAAIVTAFSGPMSTQIQQIAIFHTTAWIPLFLYGLLSGRLVPAALATAGMLLAGHTQIASYALAIGAAALLAESWRKGRTGEPVLRPAAAALAGLALGASLASVMLLPAVELLAISMRGGGVTTKFASVMAFEDWHFPLVYDPAAFSELKGDPYWTYPYVGTSTLALSLAGLAMAGRGSRAARLVVVATGAVIAVRPLLSAFVSLTRPIEAVGEFYLAHWSWLVFLSKGWPLTAALLPLAVLSLLAIARPSRPLTCALLALAALALSLGPSAPVVGSVFELPILSQGRGTVRFFHLYAPAIALLAAFPVAARGAARLRPARAALLAALPLPLATVLAFAPWEQRWPKAPFFLGLVTVGAWLLGTRHGVPPAARFVPHAVALLELFTFGTQASRLTNPDFYRYVDVDALLPGRDRGARILTLGTREAPLVFNEGMVEDYDAVLGYEPLALRSATELVGIGAPIALYGADRKLDDLRDMQDVAGPSFLGPRTLPLLGLMRCRYVLCRGVELRSERRPLRADVEGTPPAQRVLAIGGRRLHCSMLRVPSTVTYRLPSSDLPLEIRWEATVDPDPGASGGLVEAVFTGTRLTARLEVDHRAVATDVLELPPLEQGRPPTVHVRTMSAPAPGPGELRLHLEAAPLDPGFTGLVWVGTTFPQVDAIDPDGARLLSERLRPLGAPGTGDDLHVYELTGALAAAVAPRRISHEDPLAALAQPGFDPREALLLSGVPEGELPPTRVLEAEDRDGVLLATYEAEAPSWLLLTRAFLPGLVAEVDGAAVPARRADLHFTAVPVPAGRHTLSLRYAPPSYRLALFATALSLAALLLVAVARR